MRIKYENIAILLFLSNIIIAVVGIVFIQDTLEIASHTGNLNTLKTYVNTHSYELIIIIILQVFLSGLLWITAKEIAKKGRLKSVDPLTQETEVLNDNQEDESQNTLKLKLKKQHLIDNMSALPTDIGLEKYCTQALSLIAEQFHIVQGIIYLTDQNESGNNILKVVGGYAYLQEDSRTYEFGEGLAGQVAKAQRTINIKSIPPDYINIMSGLGESTPSNLLICPMVLESITHGVMELASFKEFDQEEENTLQEVTELVMQNLLVMKKNT